MSVETKPILNETETQWRLTVSQLPDLVATHLTCAHNLSYKNKYMRAPTLYLIGRTFRLLTDLKLQERQINISESDESKSFASKLNFTMAISKWSTLINDLIKAQSHANEDAKSTKTKKSGADTTLFTHAEIAEVPPSDEPNMEQMDDYVSSSTQHLILEEIINLKHLLAHLNQQEAQAAECLLQALNLAFSIEEKPLIRSVTYELIELLGRFDAQLTSQLIALYQSCANAIDMEAIIEKSSLDPKNSLLTGYFHQVNFFRKSNLKSNILNSPVVKQLLDATKSNFTALKYLNVNSMHFR